MSTLKITVSYDYLDPSSAGPFKGRIVWDGKDRLTSGKPPKKGDFIGMPFGLAVVKSVRATTVKAA
jgi:hypothetical protein